MPKDDARDHGIPDGGAAQSHIANTIARDLDSGGVVWSASCDCGWKSPERDDEYSADWDRLGHINMA